ncbi:BZIP transcription factor [Pestalotiopsis sp. NC0098]|nr:BZIP transcription factor [Pestalotiopsis sp. NC0098]
MPGSARKTAATTNSAGSRSSSSHNNNNAAAQHLPDSSSTTTITTTNNTTNSTTHVSASTSDPILPSSAPGRTHSHARGLSVSQDASAASVADSPAESQAASPDDGTAPEDQRTKKRKGGPGSRGVANLTPEQLAKKRANDREAQRAIRERTKHTIENLENKIKDLTSQQPYQELQAVLRDKEAVEQELADVKNRMSSILSIIQPILGSQQGVYASPGPSFLPAQTGATGAVSTGTGAASTPPSAASPNSAATTTWQQPGLQSAGSSAQTSPHFDQARMISQQRHNSTHALDLGPGGEQLKLNFLLDGSPMHINRMHTGDSGAQDTANYQHMPLKHDWNGFAQAGQRPESYGQSSAPLPQHAAGYPAGQTGMPHARGDNSWVGIAAPISNCASTCPLDTLLLDFLNERRQRAAEGVPTQELVGPRYPSVKSLLNPQQSQHSHPVSKVFTDILRAFPGISHLPEKVAVLYVMFLIMRWQISPTKENYDRLPPWCVPTQSQIQVQHPAWVDHLPFPAMRERIAKAFRNPQAAQVDFPFDDFFVPFTSELSLNWPYEEVDVLIETSDGELLINPVFETHMKRLGNWTLGDQFDRTFPQLRGTYDLKSTEAG